ncbi:MAG: HAD family hydrolase [Chloroflexi bacterium]|nr:HAD family hydrolase [Chloroflexota bacterium]
MRGVPPRQLRAVLLDRDGVICENRQDYVKTWEEFQWIPGAKEAIRSLRDLGYIVIVVSNQSAVGRGIITETKLAEIHRNMVEEIREAGGDVAAIYCCTHAPVDGCGCRKPAPGLLRQALREFPLAVEKSWLISDTADDVSMGTEAGLKCILVLTSRGTLEAEKVKGRYHDVPIAQNLQQAVRWMEKAALRDRQPATPAGGQGTGDGKVL